VKTLLNGAHPWVIFPEGQMIKDKKVVDIHGEFNVYNDGHRRPPHTGAAISCAPARSSTATNWNA